MQLGVEMRADKVGYTVRLLDVGFNGGALSLNAGWIGERLGDTGHVVLTNIVECKAIWSTIFDFEIADLFIPGRINERTLKFWEAQEKGSSGESGKDMLIGRALKHRKTASEGCSLTRTASAVVYKRTSSTRQRL